MERMELLEETEDIEKYFLQVLDDDERYAKLFLVLFHKESGFTLMEKVFEISLEERFREA